MIMDQVFPSDKNISIPEAACSVCGSGGALPLSQALLMNTILENSQDTIYVKDLDSKFIMNSKAHACQFNLNNSAEMTGKCDFDYFPVEFAERSLREEQEIIRTGIPLIGHVEKLKVKPGQYMWFSASKYPLYDEQGNIIGTWGTSRNITSLKETQEALAQANEDLKQMSRLDELSGLYNRRYFYEVLQANVRNYDACLSGESRSLTDSFCLVALDIDHFKAVNDNHGHADGDEAIRHIGNLLRENCRSTDTVFRVGGDEYVILLLSTGISAARIQSERIRKAVEASPLMLRGEPYRLTVSIGVSCYDEYNDLNEFVRGADNRLYHSKRHGRNRVT